MAITSSITRFLPQIRSLTKGKNWVIEVLVEFLMYDF